MNYEVGQIVYVRDVNERRHRWVDGKPPTAEIVKVGTKLVYITNSYDKPEAYTLDDGVRNDKYGHQSLQTFEQFEQEAERTALLEKIRDAGLEVKFGHQLRIETMRQIVEVLEVSR